ncbi:hypothetical protein G3I76_45020, partial [Streptomyces sp. SID11233]|nr:hypothetical protein [Streptomyces sp. SID11233]
MGDSDPTKPRGPGLPGFAGSFAASSRRAGERDRPHVASRLVVVATVVALVAAASIGYGVLSTMQKDSGDSARPTKVVATAGGAHASERPGSPSAGAKAGTAHVKSAGSGAAADGGADTALVGPAAGDTSEKGSSSSSSGSSAGK